MSSSTGVKNAIDLLLGRKRPAATDVGDVKPKKGLFTLNKHFDCIAASFSVFIDFKEQLRQRLEVQRREGIEQRRRVFNADNEIMADEEEEEEEEEIEDEEDEPEDAVEENEEEEKKAEENDIEDEKDIKKEAELSDEDDASEGEEEDEENEEKIASETEDNEQPRPPKVSCVLNCIFFNQIFEFAALISTKKRSSAAKTTKARARKKMRTK